MYLELVEELEAKRARRSSELNSITPDPKAFSPRGGSTDFQATVSSSHRLSSISLDPAMMTTRRSSSVIRFSDADFLLLEEDEHLPDKPNLSKLYGYLAGGNADNVSDSLKVLALS